MLDGDPGDGKSTMVTDVAARISVGASFPDDAAGRGARAVVLLSAEDAADDTIRPRLDAAGADPGRVVIFDGVTITAEDGSTRCRPPSIPGDLDHLEQLVVQEGAVLVVVDVLNAFLSGAIDGHRDQDVRAALMPLARMAERTGCCVVCIRHLNKAGGSNPLYRGGGSIAFIGGARVGLLVGKDPEDESRRVLAVTKSNVAAAPPALAYRLVDAPEHGCARVQWEGPTSHRAADLLTGNDDARGGGDDAVSTLRQVLADGPMWSTDVVAAMGEAGYSASQTNRARRRAGATTEKVGRPGDAEQGWRWRLPSAEGCEGDRAVGL